MRKAVKVLALVGGIVAATTLVTASIEKERRPEGSWLAGDFHTHTFLTDGSHTQQDVLHHAFQYGLDWIANSEHGGAYSRDPQGNAWPATFRFLGNPPIGTVWRWQSLLDVSFPIIRAARDEYPGKVILQSYEWNVPSHEHASVGIVGADERCGLSVAQHEYLFDSSDSGTTSNDFLRVDGKVTTNTHAKAVAGVKYLQDNFAGASYMLLNHPSRRGKYSASDIRDFNDAAPDVAFGLEGMPGHQKEPCRAGYTDVNADRRTYGGADPIVAKVGGIWDSLLAEGRHFWVFANSDFHSSAADADFWPGEYSKSYTYVDGVGEGRRAPATALVAGLRSGKSFSAHGGLVDGLDFRAGRNSSQAEMGETLIVRRGSEVWVTIRFRSPRLNNNGQVPVVNHVDLIAGPITGPAIDRTTAANPGARVIKRFYSYDWESEDGWHVVRYRLTDVTAPVYLRLRGTNLAPGTPGETDAEGNPLIDSPLDVPCANTPQAAFADLWFYSNPVFVQVKEAVSVRSGAAATGAAPPDVSRRQFDRADRRTR